MLDSKMRNKLALMSNAELKDFLKHSEHESPEVRKAARTEAIVRDLDLSEIPAVVTTPIFTTPPEEHPSQKQTSDYWGKDHQVEDENAPLLYSRRAVYSLSFAFSVLFGAVLMVLNLRNLKKHEGVVPTISFSVAYLATAVWLVTFVESHFQIEVKGSMVIASVGGWLLQYYLWNKYIGKDLKYRKRSVAIPVVIGVVLIGFSFAAIPVLEKFSDSYRSTHTMSDFEYGSQKHHILYDSTNVSPAQVLEMAQKLDSVGLFQVPKPLLFKMKQVESRYELYFLVKDSAWYDPEVQRSGQNICDDLQALCSDKAIVLNFTSSNLDDVKLSFHASRKTAMQSGDTLKPVNQ